MNWARLLLPGLLVAVAVGCVSAPPLLSSLATAPEAQSSVELRTVPFYRQRSYQCGPAALAMALNYSGVSILPDALVPEVYLPKRKGSLQIDLVTSARRHGRVPYAIEGGMKSLLTELRAGRPVLVLQNLGWAAHPVWHYAVVIGYDAPHDSFILRSGHTQRKLVSARKFDATWTHAQRWGLVLLKPGEIPDSASEQAYLSAAAAAEPQLESAAREAMYSAALQRWTNSAVAQFGLSQAQHAAGDARAAEASLRALLRQHPEHVPAYNNLAYLLAQRGCKAQAQELISVASAKPQAQAWRAALVETETEIRRMPGKAAAGECQRAYP